MRKSYLGTLILLLAIFACKKSSSDGPTDPNPNPPVTVDPKVSFKIQRYGTAELWKHFLSNDKTIATLSGALRNEKFSWEITGSNGTRKTTDTLVKGSGITDNLGNATIDAFSLYDYKDGTLTLQVRFNNATTAATASGTTNKEEFMIRTYKDLMAIYDWYTKRDPSDTYVQMQDIAFPDTIFTNSPINELHANYDGRGFKVTNLTVVVPPRTGSTLDYAGLFSSIGSNATVKNVRLELSAAGIKANSISFCGGLAGSNYGTLLNCSVKGSVNGGTCSFCDAGGITGQTINGRIIGCSFNGTLAGIRTGGISPLLQNSYINMCYSNYSISGNGGSGTLTGNFVAQSDKLIHDTVYNCYAYIKQATVALPLKSLFGDLNVLYANCYSNHGTIQPNTISYTTASELTTLLNTLVVGNLPAGITAPPSNKPFKSSGDPNQPPVLWWE